MVVLGGFTAVVLLGFFSAIWSGYVLSIIWGWFIVPVFHLPALGINAAIGVSLVVGVLTHQVIKEPEDKRSVGAKIMEAGVQLALRPAVVLLFGWIIRQFA